MPSWRVAAELALRFGVDFDLETVEEIQDEIARVAPAFSGVDSALLRQARDGVVLPLAEHAEEIAFGIGRVASGLSWEPIPPAPEDAGACRRSGGGGRGEGRRARRPSRWRSCSGGTRARPSRLRAFRSTPTLCASWRAVRSTDQIVSSLRPRRSRVSASAPRLLVHPFDRDRIGVADGDVVRATTGRGSVELPIHADADTPQGVAFVAVNQAGPGAADLIDLTLPVTDLRVETVR